MRGLFGSAPPESIIDCEAFPVFDDFILQWIRDRLLAEDVGASVNGMNIPAICDLRIKKHFGAIHASFYTMLSAAYEIIKRTQYSCPDNFAGIVAQYINTDYKTDSHYRHFYAMYERHSEDDRFEDLRVLIENIYTNKYLNKLLPAWNAAIDVKSIMKEDKAQLQFYKKHIRSVKEKTIVIVSDALRYEVGRELFEKLDSDPNCDVKISYMFGALPAYTQLGMAALLPHTELKVRVDGKVTVDGKASDTTEKREAILRAALPNSKCRQIDRLPVKREKLREIFTGMDSVYIYHDQIDKRASSSENEVFNACAEAVEEIYALVKRLSGSANVYHFIITADHGFLYKRESFTESEKISLGFKDAFTDRRFVVADTALTSDGVASVPMADIIGGDDGQFVSWPIGANVFKTHGRLNFVHGAASPQEMILPLLKVKMEKSHVETYPAKIALVSTVKKITNLITQLEFIQKEPVSDIIKTTEYKLYFLSEENERISNEQIYIADKKETDPIKRIFRLGFNFKNKKYDSAKQYWLIAAETGSGAELFRHQIMMDIAYADDFGFDS